MDECLRLLEDCKEYPSDDLLVYLTRVQLICNKGSLTTFNDLFGDVEMRTPADLYMKTLRSQLDDLVHSIPTQLKSNGKPWLIFSSSDIISNRNIATLQLHIFNTTLSIHERCLSSTVKMGSDLSDKIQCTENLWICFTAIKSWCNTFFSLETFPLSTYTQFSMMPLTQMAHCLVALFRLSTFESPGVAWDRQRIRQEMDFGDIVKLIVDRWDQVPEANGIEMLPGRRESTEDGQESDQPWFHAMRKILVIKNLWEHWDVKVGAMTASDAEKTDGQDPVDNGVANGIVAPGMQHMGAWEYGGMNLDLLDDNWMRDMLGGGGCDFNF